MNEGALLKTDVLEDMDLRNMLDVFYESEKKLLARLAVCIFRLEKDKEKAGLGLSMMSAFLPVAIFYRDNEDFMLCEESLKDLLTIDEIFSFVSDEDGAPEEYADLAKPVRDFLHTGLGVPITAINDGSVDSLVTSAKRSLRDVLFLCQSAVSELASEERTRILALKIEPEDVAWSHSYLVPEEEEYLDDNI